MPPAVEKLFNRVSYSLLSAGIDLRKFATFIRKYPQFRKQRAAFVRMGGTVSISDARLFDYEDQAGQSQGHYFHVDLVVASYIHADCPARHIDVGSRIDGFVAHVAAFRKIEVIDIRALDVSQHDNISFLQLDLTDSAAVQPKIADSISCLHAIEHFGLGRYGDPLDPHGHIKGFAGVAKMLAPGGKLYIAFPISDSPRVVFNGERVFHPRDILSWQPGIEGLELVRFDYVGDDGLIHRDADLNGEMTGLSYGCGIYTFTKKA